jgi:hypothetical protein
VGSGKRGRTMSPCLPRCRGRGLVLAKILEPLDVFFEVVGCVNESLGVFVEVVLLVVWPVLLMRVARSGRWCKTSENGQQFV